MIEAPAISLADDAATRAAGAALARAWPGPLRGVIHLEGDLGAGKTTLAQAFLAELGVEGPVRSPTYTLVEPYEMPRGRVLHMDLYRLAGADELAGLGLEDDPPEQTLWLVEWPERGEGVLPPPTLRIRLSHREAGRALELATPAGGPLHASEIAPLIQAIL